LGDADASVRQAACHAASIGRDREALTELVPLLADPSHHVRRAAAEALGRLGDSAAVPDLLTATTAEHDRVLEHALIYAMIEIADPHSTADGLSAPDVRTRRAALIALDQMPGAGLDPPRVAGLLDSPDAIERETAAWIAERHPEWGDALVDHLARRLEAVGPDAAEQEELARQLARFARAPSVETLLASCAQDSGRRLESRRVALAGMALAGLKEAPPGWVEAVIAALADGDGPVVAAAVEAARGLRVSKDAAPGFEAALLAAGHATGLAVPVRLTALAAAPAGPGELPEESFALLAGIVAEEGDVARRALAADVLGRARLSHGQLLELTGVLASSGPLEADRLLPAYKECGDEQVGAALVAALVASPVRAGLRFDTLRQALAHFSPEVQSQARPLYAALNIDPDAQRAKLESLVASLPAGDIRRGQAVFHSAKAACAACHQMGYVGGNVGPDMTRIGQTRNERDLLESIVFPSASFVRSFEPTLIVTTDGRIVNGLVRSEADGLVVLATGPREEVRIALEDIEERHPGRISTMPSGLDQQLSMQDLADLIAFLKAAR
jgi:putative heme-binding domain-containing protein